MISEPVRIFLIDQPEWVQKLHSLIHDSPEVTIVGTASNSQEAHMQIGSIQADVICLNLTNPILDGIHLLRTVMANHPTPFIVFINKSEEHIRSQLQEFEQTGTIQVITRTEHPNDDVPSINASQFLQTLKVLGGVMVLSRPHQRHDRHSQTQHHDLSSQITSPPGKIVAIGASTGGPRAFAALFRQLPRSLSVPIICVQHLSLGFTSELVRWLQEDSAIQVTIAKSGVDPQPGIAYFPEEQTHLTIDSTGALHSSHLSPTQGHHQAIDETFQSIAQFYGPSAIGVLLTGMGCDGMKGMQAISQAGGTTIAQTTESCVVASMPQAVIDAKAATHVLPLERMTPTLLQLIGQPHKVRQ